MRAHVFRLYPEEGPLFVRVVVHPTKKAMFEHHETLRAEGVTSGLERQAVGYCSPLEIHNYHSRRWRIHPCFAEVFFFRSRLGTEVVTHELFHATMAWARRVRFAFGRLGDDDSVNQDEERVAYAHSTLCRQFVDRASKAGLYS